MRFSLLLLVLLMGAGSTRKQRAPASATFEPPRVVSTAEAVYPLRSVATGTVVLDVLLDETGKITDGRVVRGITSLTEEAEHAVRQWKFRAARLNGRAVSAGIPGGLCVRSAKRGAADIVWAQ
jgi:TonB family protein